MDGPIVLHLDDQRLETGARNPAGVEGSHGQLREFLQQDLCDFALAFIETVTQFVDEIALAFLVEGGRRP